MKSYNDKKIFFSLFLVALVAGTIGGRLEWLRVNGNPALSSQSATALGGLVTPEPPTLTLGFVGDIMLDRGVKASVNKNFDGDYAKLFTDTDFLAEPDITFANLEGPVSDKGFDKQNLYSFRMDPKVLPIIKASGIDVVSFANNHVGDWGRAAFNDTLKRIAENGILSCGAGMTKADTVRPAIVEQQGYRVGFLCFSDVGPDDMAATETKSGILLASDPEFDTIVQNAAREVNALIVSFHWGDEYKPLHNDRQELLAKKAIENGAVMIAGHHPHVAEDISEHNGAPILYSLGNFIFDQKFSKETMQGLFVTAELKGTKVSEVTPYTVLLDSTYSPSLQPE